jgi:hypothetical protein
LDLERGGVRKQRKWWWWFGRCWNYKRDKELKEEVGGEDLR